MKFMNRKRLIVAIGALAATALLAGGIHAVIAGSGEAQKSDSPSADRAESRMERVEGILRDESQPAEKRVAAALAELESAKADSPADDRDVWLGAMQSDPLAFDMWEPSRFFADGWDPFADMRRMRSMSQRLFADIDRQLGMLSQHQSLPARDAFPWAPAGEFSETDEAYIYKFDIPGVGQPELKVTTEGNRLTVEGRRSTTVESKEQDSNGKARVLRREVQSGAFKRIVTLPGDAESTGIEARLDNGVLTVTIPRKKADSKSRETRTIEIKQ